MNQAQQRSPEFLIPANIDSDIHHESVDLKLFEILPKNKYDASRETEVNEFNRNMEISTDLYDFETIWQTYQGQNIKVAVLDSGLDVNHPAFPTAIIRRAACVNNGTIVPCIDNGKLLPDANLICDTNGHGTHCAGIIAARPLKWENGTWVAYEPVLERVSRTSQADGAPQLDYMAQLRTEKAKRGLSKRNLKWAVYPNAGRPDPDPKADNIEYKDLTVRFSGIAVRSELLIYKITHADAAGVDRGEAWIGDMALAINDAVDFGADIISISIQAEKNSDQLFHAVHRALSERRTVVCSAGNRGALGPINIGFPARYGGVLTVAAHNRFGQPAAFTSSGGEVDVSAPGEDVWSTWKDRSYAQKSGTSMAAPWVAGIAALILGKHRAHANETNPQLTPVRNSEEMREHLLRMAAHNGFFRQEDGYGALSPGNYFGRDSSTQI